MINRDESKIESFQRIIDTLKAINKIIVDEKEIDSLLKKTCEVLTQIRGYSFCWIGLFDQNNKLHQIESSHHIAGFEKLKEQILNGILPANLTKAIKNQEFLQIDSPDNICPVDNKGKENSSFIAPISIDNKHQGILCASVPLAYAQLPKEAENYVDIATSIGFAINAITEKKDMAWLLATSPHGIITFDHDLTVVGINNRFCELFNCTEKDILGKNIADLVTNNLNENTHESAFVGLKQITRGDDIRDMKFVLGEKIFRIETQQYDLKNYRIARIKDITKEQTEKIELEKSEKKYKNLVEGLNDALFILQDGVVKFVNKSLCKISGYTKKELLNTPYTKFIAPSELKKIKDKHAKRLQGERVKHIYQSKAIHKNGEEIPVEVTIIQVEYEERPAYQILLHDITTRQNTLQQLKESEERFRFLAESAFEGILIHKNGDIVDVNDAFLELSGYSKDEIVGRNIFEYMYSEQDVKRLKKQVKNRKNSPYTLKGYKKSGEPVYMEIESKTIQYNGEEVKIAGIRNITERQLLNEKLNETKNRLNNLLNNLPGMVYTCYNRKNWEMLFMSEGCIALTGYTPNEFINNPELDYNDIIHPGFRNEVWDKVQEAIKYDSAFEIEYKIICKNKEEKWVWERGRKAIQNNEEVLEGFISDITERKNATNSVLQSQAKYRTLFKAINDAVIIQDYEKENHPIIEVNNRACKLYGYSREELLSKTIKDLDHSLHSSYENTSEQIYETIHQKANGSAIPVDIKSSIFQIGNKRMIMSLIRDTSLRKEAEKKLSDSEHLLDQILQSIPSGFVMIDENRTIRRVNDQTCKITGFSQEELEGQKCSVICVKKDLLKECPVCFSGKESYNGIDTYIKCKNRSKTAVLKNIQTIEINGEKFILESFQDITKLKIAEQQLIKARNQAQESEQKFSSFMESLPGFAYIKDLGKNYVYVNSYMKHNLNAGDWIGKNTKDVMNSEIADRLVENDEKAFSLGRLKYEIKYPVHGKGIRDFLTYKFTIGNDKKLLGGISLDITERKSLESRNAMLSKAIEASPVSIVITDINGDIEYVNPFFEEKTGYKLQEVLFENPRILKSGKQTKEFYADMWKTIVAGKVWRGEFHNKKKNGEEFWEKVIITPLVNDEKKVEHFIAIKEDITHQKQMLTDLRLAKEKAEESDKLKSAFLANMSHEIRTPMNGIMGFTELLKDPNLSGEQQHEFISIIQKSGDRMLSTINDIIDISKIESGLVSVDLSTFELNSFLNEIRLFFNPETAQKKLYLEFINSNDSVSHKINSDAVKLNSILTNLIKNAIKFTNKGGITFGYQFVNSSIQFIVKDTGVGIPKDRQQAIFDRFVQADFADSRVYEGSGLGLSITKSYTEMLGGSIRLESEENKGTTFFVTFPYHQPLADTFSAGSEETELKSVSGNLKMLIAEDDPVSVELLKMILPKTSKEILVAGNGKEAVDAVKANPDIDLILMDIRMPIMDGLEAIEQIRKFNKDVKIIAQTAFAQEQDILKAFNAGCNNYISKPINAKNLGSIINNLF